jgi:trehalose-phosphatase
MRDVTPAPAALPPLPIPAVLDARRRGGLVAVFDLDGTLAPIGPSPAAVHLDRSTTRALARLAGRTDTTAGVVSGRPLADLARLLDVPDLWLFGLHGWEHRPPRADPVRSWSARARAVAQAQLAALAPRLGEPQGELVEDKGPIVAVHTRNASPARRCELHEIVRETRRPELAIVAGRCVLELRPAHGPTKGTAVHAIATSRPSAPILYIGDDTTDEDAFAALGPHDFAVLVDDLPARDERPHERETRARFAVDGPPGVARVLDALANGESCPQ